MNDVKITDVNGWTKVTKDGWSIYVPAEMMAALRTHFAAEHPATPTPSTDQAMQLAEKALKPHTFRYNDRAEARRLGISEVELSGVPFWTAVNLLADALVSPVSEHPATPTLDEFVRDGVCLSCGGAVLNSGEHVEEDRHLIYTQPATPTPSTEQIAAVLHERFDNYVDHDQYNGLPYVDFVAREIAALVSPVSEQPITEKEEEK